MSSDTIDETLVRSALLVSQLAALKIARSRRKAADYRKVDQTLAEMKGKLHDMSAQYNGVVEERDAARKEASGAVALMNKARDERDNALADLKQVQKAYDDLQALHNVDKKTAGEQIAKLQEQVKAQSAELQARHEAIQGLRASREAFKADVETLKAEVAFLEQGCQIGKERVANVIDSFKGSEAGTDWVQEEMAPKIRELAQAIMEFVNSQAPGINWRLDPICANALDSDNEEDDGQGGAVQDVAAIEAAPSQPDAGEEQPLDTNRPEVEAPAPVVVEDPPAAVVVDLDPPAPAQE